MSRTKLHRVDSLNVEAGKISSTSSGHASKGDWKTILSLAFQSVGVIYGDIGTSPLYVFSSTFTDKIGHKDDILGVLSLIIYTIILIPLTKYVFIVLWANDEGNGGAFALYSLICRYAEVSLIPNQEPEDRDLSYYGLDIPSNQLKRAQKMRQNLENSIFAKIFLVFLAILGTSMVIGDGILTPCMSVLSAVSGIKPLHQEAIMYISIAILIALFSFQRFGTDKVGYTFAPAISVWFLLISGIGLYNLFKYDVSVLRAFNPMYIIQYFKRNGKKGWLSLGGVFLCITGGAFALYSLICRYAKVSLIPNEEPEDRDLSCYGLDIPSNQLKRAQKTRQILENSIFAKIVLVLLAILGTSMVIGDGIITPCISVLSAVNGLKLLSQEANLYISIAILVAVFCFQRFGTDKVGYIFATAISVWFLLISGIGLYNLFKYDVTVLRAFNPMYIIYYFKRNGKKGWLSLGGVFLCITGSEAMFADLGHFSVRSVQISFSCLVFPSILSAYIGQAAYLSKFPTDVWDAFYASVPDPLYWPTFVVAVVASIIASQAMISGAFSTVAQAQRQGCFPRVKVVHTSAKHEGQVYIPELNYFLMISCVLVTLTFKTTGKLGNMQAYGIAVLSVEIITTNMVTLIMLLIWKISIWRIALFYTVYVTIETTCLSAQLTKFVEGGYLPMTISLVFVFIMGIWHYVQKQRYHFELNNKVSSDYIRDLAKNPDIKRIPGIGLIYSELLQEIPPIFPHLVSNIPSVHSVIILVSIKSIPISKVALEERFLFRHVDPRDYKVFRCVVRLGYNDQFAKPEDFENQLIKYLKEFIQQEHFIIAAPNDQETEIEPAVSGHVEEELQQEVDSIIIAPNDQETEIEPAVSGHMEEELQQEVDSIMSSPNCSIRSINSPSAQSNQSSSQIQIVSPNMDAEEEMQFVENAKEQGVFYLLGEAEVVTKQDSSFLKKFAVNYAYTFLRKNFRQEEKMMAIPKTRLLRVGMTYEL